MSEPRVSVTPRDPIGAPVPPFPRADFARARTLLSLGRRGPEDGALAFDLLRRLLDHAERLEQQRTALRAIVRALVTEREGRLCYLIGDSQLVPMPANVERAVRGALAAARPSAA